MYANCDGWMHLTLSNLNRSKSLCIGVKLEVLGKTYKVGVLLHDSIIIDPPTHSAQVNPHPGEDPRVGEADGRGGVKQEDATTRCHPSASARVSLPLMVSE